MPHTLTGGGLIAVTLAGIGIACALSMAVSACQSEPQLEPMLSSDSLSSSPGANREVLTATPTPPSAGPASVQILGHGEYEPPSYEGAATLALEWRILAADVIVRAKLLSRSNQALRFTALDYLKGTGPDEFSVRLHTNRNTQWDDQEAVLFLTRQDGVIVGAPTDAKTSEFAFLDVPYSGLLYMWEYRGSLPLGITPGARNPVWLPIQPSSDGIATSTSSEETTNVLTDFVLGGPAPCVGSTYSSDTPENARQPLTPAPALSQSQNSVPRFCG